jgi:hypothetical protein
MGACPRGIGGIDWSCEVILGRFGFGNLGREIWGQTGLFESLAEPLVFRFLFDWVDFEESWNQTHRH